MGSFLRRHRFTLIVLATWLVVAWLAWPLAGRCIWTGIIALLVIGGWSFAKWLSDPDTFR